MNNHKRQTMNRVKRLKSLLDDMREIAEEFEDNDEHFFYDQIDDSIGAFEKSIQNLKEEIDIAESNGYFSENE